MNKSLIFGIKDRFHSFINGECTPEVRSDHPCFENDEYEFFIWCAQHGGEDEIYCIDGNTSENLEILSQLKHKYYPHYYNKGE